jgi:uncharacterized membrane protein (DUF373 family)
MMMNDQAIWDKHLEQYMKQTIRVVRYFLLALMIIYLFFCVVSLAGILISELIANHGVLSVETIRDILTDTLLVLIILAIIRTLFISNGFDYALAFLEIGFVVLVRKLLLIQTTPEEAWLILVLGIVSALLFGLIILIYHLRHRWKMESRALP